ncbi:sulfite exporter TauE/SafE family protein [Clostridium sp.]|uniref:sulfite exporter TauE/SafE family protein n=1 Tax=Clostridium sp. TaxID=1506 RepID=UPI002FC87374
MEMFNTFDLSLWQWVLLVLAGFLVGASKTGLSGLLMPVIPIMANIFGGKESTGIILPMLIVGDVFALYYYKQHADWGKIKKLVLWTFSGLILGVIIGNYINDKQFKIFIGISVLLCLIVLIYTERKGEEFQVPNSPWIHGLAGILSGLTSMIGNAAGPIFSVYLLAMGFKKNDFMGTTAWFFFIINLSKVPLQILFWQNISFKTLGLTVIGVPIIALGAVFGAFILKKINEKVFRTLILVMTALAAIRLFI